MASSSSNGRPSKLTPEIQEKILSAIRVGNYAHVAAAYAGLSERTFYRWIQRGQRARTGPYRQFCDAIEVAEREAEVRAVAILQKHMEESWQAASTFLSRRYPERWSRRARLSVDVSPKEVLCDLLSMSADELDEAVETAARL